MASPRSRLVTWSHTHLSFYGRRFWRPHPDLDRAATPALPPGGGRPLCGGRFPLLAAALGCFGPAPQTTSPGAEPPEPHVRGRVLGATDGGRWVRRAACVGARDGLRWARRGGCLWWSGFVVAVLSVSQVRFHIFK